MHNWHKAKPNKWNPDLNFYILSLIFISYGLVVALPGPALTNLLTYYGMLCVAGLATIVKFWLIYNLV